MPIHDRLSVSVRMCSFPFFGILTNEILCHNFSSSKNHFVQFFGSIKYTCITHSLIHCWWANSLVRRKYFVNVKMCSSPSLEGQTLPISTRAHGTHSAPIIITINEMKFRSQDECQSYPLKQSVDGFASISSRYSVFHSKVFDFFLLWILSQILTRFGFKMVSNRYGPIRNGCGTRSFSSLLR